MHHRQYATDHKNFTLQIGMFIAENHTIEETAEEFSIAEGTVRKFVSSIQIYDDDLYVIVKTIGLWNLTNKSDVRLYARIKFLKYQYAKKHQREIQ